MVDMKLLNEFQLAADNFTVATRLTLRRLLSCSRYVTAGGEVKLVRLRNGGKTLSHFTGVMRCQDHWMCPRCTPIYLQQYRAIVDEVIRRKRDAGFTAIMMTLTVPHRRSESALTVMTRLRKTKNRYESYSLRTKLGDTLRKGGTITSTEMRYSEHAGWHFHYHVLYFVAADASTITTISDNESLLRQQWAECIADEKGGAVQGYTYEAAKAQNIEGVHISRNDDGTVREIYDGEYITKEFVKAGGHKNPYSRSIWDIMQEAIEGNENSERLLIEFKQAIKNRVRLRLSRNLITRDERTEIKKNVFRNLEADGGIETVVVASFTRNDWRSLIEKERMDGVPHRYNLLEIAKTGEWVDVAAYCCTNGIPLPRPDPKHVTWQEVLAAEFVSPATLELFNSWYGAYNYSQDAALAATTWMAAQVTIA